MPRIELRRGRYGFLVAETLEAAGEPMADVLPIALVEVVGAEFVERLATSQDVIGDDELAVADRSSVTALAPWASR